MNIFFRVKIKEGLPRTDVFDSSSWFINKKLRDPFLPKLTEAETPQVTTAKLPYGTRKNPLRAATFLS